MLLLTKLNLEKLFSTTYCDLGNFELIDYGGRNHLYLIDKKSTEEIMYFEKSGVSTNYVDFNSIVINSEFTELTYGFYYDNGKCIAQELDLLNQDDIFSACLINSYVSNYITLSNHVLKYRNYLAINLYTDTGEYYHPTDFPVLKRQLQNHFSE